MSTSHDSRDLEAQTEARRWFSSWAMVYRNSNDDGKNQKRREAAEYGDSSSIYWKLYASEAEISDQKLVETLTGDTNSMLILNGIFSSIIASFIIETYHALQPDTNQETVCLLSQLVSQENSFQQSSPYCSSSYPGGPSSAAIRSNILLFLSFFLAMVSVLACALIQQWCREFMKYAYPRAAPHKRGRVRTYLFRGLNRSYMRRFMYGVHVLLHISVFLFFCGVSDYLHDVYPRVGMISWYCVITLAMVYVALSIAPLIIGSCPYQTALTPPLQFGGRLLHFLGRVVWRSLCFGTQGTWPRREDLHFRKNVFLVEEANTKAENLDPYAMKWLFTDNDFGDTDMDRFLLGLPGYIHSHFTVTKDLPKVLTAPYILRRIREHLLTCATATELSEQARVNRVSACVDSLRVIFQHRTIAENHDEEKSLQVHMQSIVDGLNTLCEESDGIVDLRAYCIRALAFQGFLEPAKVVLPKNKFPGYLTPLYTFFSSWDNMSQTQRDTVPPSVGVSDEKAPPPAGMKAPPLDEDKMWRTTLNDGPLINLTLLAGAMLSQDDVDPSSLSMCWKTLDILRSELRINKVDVSDSSLSLFNEAHELTRTRVGAEEPGFSVVPLLEVLDAVAGGRRLSLVFLGRPKYYSKADLVFRKDHLRNPDLLRAFANCLPDFVTKHPEKSMEFMEGLVCYDYLWTSLQVNLLNSLRSNTFIPTKLRVFDTCCTVIDAAFLALENSSNVDWRSPDLGSLAHYFELFVTDCFQGMFVDRAIGFRVGLIKARFCKAVLTQFLDEFNREGTVVFRSQWDVASLARVLYSLGVGTDEDVEFWKSFVDGGPIGADFIGRTHAMLGTAARDGPLLNFCKLGRLGVMAVPLKGSGLEDTDYFKKLLELLQKMTVDTRLPLAVASPLVWEDLGRLREEVSDICAGSSNKDKASMKDLLTKIDAVYELRPISTQEHNPSDHVQSQAPETSAILQSNPLLRGQIPANDRSSYASSTTVIGDRHDGSPTQEDDFRGFTPAPLNSPRGGFPNLYSTPYPLLPSQIGPGGAIPHPFSASFLPTLSPPAGSMDQASPGIPTIQHPSPYMRYNSQHRRAPVYYPPRRDTRANRSATLSPSSPPPTRMLSAPSNRWFASSSSNGVYSSTPPASPVHENE